MGGEVHAFQRPGDGARVVGGEETMVGWSLRLRAALRVSQAYGERNGQGDRGSWSCLRGATREGKDRKTFWRSVSELRVAGRKLEGSEVRAGSVWPSTGCSVIQDSSSGLPCARPGAGTGDIV